MSQPGLGGIISTSRDLARSEPSAFAFVAVAGVLALIPALGVPLLLRTFLDEYLVAGDTSWGLPVVAGILAAAFLTGFLAGLQGWVLARFATRLSAQRPTAFVWHALRAPVPLIDGLGSADVSARGSALQRQAYQAGFLVPLAAINLLNLLVFSIALLVLDLRLGAAALIVVAVSTAASRVALSRRESRQVAADRLRVQQGAHTTQVVAQFESIKASAAEQWIFDAWCQSRNELGSAVADLGAAGQRLGAIAPLTQTLGFGAVLGVGAWMVLTGQLSMGTLVASQALLLGVLVPASLVVWLGVLLQGVASTKAQSDLVERLPLDPEVLPVANPAPDPTAGPVAINLRGVTFGYELGSAPLLVELNLEVPAGSTVAVVGSSGSGKSTLARLAIGELQPWSGTVEIAGHPRLELTRSARARAVAYVPQNPVLIPGTIADNITMFDSSIPLTAVLAATRDACIQEAINARPLGLQEVVSESGHGFSGGELQRLVIARALVRDPQLLVLDEATSALDPIVESELEANLRARDCTCLLVAHRLSSVRDADRIVVLDAGRIVQQGTFDQLRQGGLFSELLHG